MKLELRIQLNDCPIQLLSAEFGGKKRYLIKFAKFLFNHKLWMSILKLSGGIVAVALYIKSHYLKAVYFSLVMYSSQGPFGIFLVTIKEKIGIMENYKLAHKFPKPHHVFHINAPDSS